MWFTAVLGVLQVVDKMIPVVERVLPRGTKEGVKKAEVVASSTAAAAQALLPGVDMNHPTVQAALKEKIAADVKLANLLQALAEAAGAPK